MLNTPQGRRLIRQAAPGVFLDDLQQLHLGHLGLAPLGRAIAQTGAGQVLAVQGTKVRKCGEKVGKMWGKKHLWKSFKVSKPIFRGFHGSFQVRNWKPMTNTVSDGSSKMCWHGINQHTNLLNEDAERNPSTKMGGTKIPPATRSSLMAAAPEPLISLATFIFIQPVLGLRVFRITSYIVGVKLISKTSPNHDFRKLHAKLMRGARVHMRAHSVNMPRLSTVIDHRGPTRLGTATALHTPSMGNKCPTGIMPGIGIHI